MIALLLAAAAAAHTPAPKGKLVLLVVVDQLRYQDVLWLGPELGPKGFAGLGRPRALRYDTVVTETAADHAVLSTGAYAELNGIVGNRFWENGKEHEAVEDANCPVWGAPQLGRSAAMLRVPTVGDAFKLGLNGAGKVVSVAVKDRTALFLGGPSADLALWLEMETGQMASTTCYAPAAPEWLAALEKEHPAAEWKDWTWNMGKPEVVSRLVPQGKAAAGVPKNDIGPVFPHRVGQGKVDKRLYWALRNSPASTTIVLRAARAALKGLQLGQGAGTDLLTVGLSAVDGVGHQFGVHSRERVDATLRMHEELTAFLDEVRKDYGARVSIVLTSDHGLTPMEADEKRLHVSMGGTIDIDGLTAKLNQALSDALGWRKEPWVGTIDGSTLTLRPPFPARAVQVAAELLRQEPGIWRAVTADQLEQEPASLRHAVFPGRSGQVLIVPRPLWTLKKPSDGADHGSPWNDDALVPLFVQAPGFRLHGEPVLRATQVAPTVAALLGVAAPAAALDQPAIEQE